MMGKGFKKGVLFVVMMFVAVLSVGSPSEAATKTKISKNKVTLCVGETVKLKVTGSSAKVKWKSSNSKIAKVSKEGLVTAKKKGNCVITATKSGKKYTCKVKVVKLPKNYATVNGKKVKVGKTVKLTYKIQSKKPISMISIKYKYNYDALQIVNGAGTNRYPTWECNEYYPESYDDDKSLCDIAHLVGVDPNAEYYNDWTGISCKKAKVMECMKVKVLKSGNYTVKLDVYHVSDDEFNTVKDYKVTETIK